MTFSITVSVEGLAVFIIFGVPVALGLLGVAVSLGRKLWLEAAK